MSTLQFLGATGTVTGSKYLLEASGEQLMIDCGLFQGAKELRLRNWDPFPFPPEQLDAVVLTHAHLDHVGYLPALVRAGFRGPVHCTPNTAALQPSRLKPGSTRAITHRATTSMAQRTATLWTT